MNYKLIFCFATVMILFCNNEVKAQNEYFSDDPVWLIHKWAIGGDGYQELRIITDTVINDYQYMGVGGYDNTPGWANTEYSYDNDDVPIYVAFLRSENHEIWWRNLETSADELLYSFQADIGDTLIMHPRLLKYYEETTDSTYCPFIVTSIDSMMIGAEWLKIFYSDSECYSDNSFVFEGIGNNAGPLLCFSGECDMIGADISCFLWEGELYAAADENPSTLSTEFTNEYCFLSHISSKPESNLWIWPNPVTDFIQIGNHGNSSISKIKITDTTGRLVLTAYNQQQMDVAHLPSGIYFIEVSTDESRAVLRFVKE